MVNGFLTLILLIRVLVQSKCGMLMVNGNALVTISIS